MAIKQASRLIYDKKLLKAAFIDALVMLRPSKQIRNPVMFVVLVVSVVTTALFVQALFGQGEAPTGFILAVAIWLWLTLLFANLAEAIAQGLQTRPPV